MKLREVQGSQLHTVPEGSVRQRSLTDPPGRTLAVCGNRGDQRKLSLGSYASDTELRL